jgi:L-malate glycosyltransferase
LTLRKKILIAGDINSTHTQKWIVGLSDYFELAVFSFSPIKDKEWDDYLKEKQITLVSSKFSKSGKWSKALYIFQLPKLIRLKNNFKPDIIHAYYATSYGLIVSLTSHHCKVLSIWGSDVYQFPKKSPLHKVLFRYILSKFKHLYSTSHHMAKEIARYTEKTPVVIPFGVDTNRFNTPEGRANRNLFVVGTVKSLEEVYGIDRLIDAFGEFHKKYPQSECKIYGSGTKLNELLEKTKKLGLESHVSFMGKIPHPEVPSALNELDVYCALSRNESFGVAVLEASSCKIPVIVTNTGGLPEVVAHNETGYIINEDSLNQIPEILLKLANDESLRKHLGENGRTFVIENYSWTRSLEETVDAYNSLLSL